MTGVTAQVAAFTAGLSPAAIPTEVATVAKRHIQDSLGVMAAGHLEAVTGIVLRRALAYRGVEEASVVGRPERLPAALAAWVNGVSGHALDYDDTQLATRPESVYGLLTHPSVPVLAACLAAAEIVSATGSDLLTAFVAGTEVECHISDASNPAHYRNGLHSSGTVGTLGAALGAARLLRLDAEATARTLGIAASQAAGLRENFGTMTKSLHVGRAAQHGLEAALLARDGFTAAANILEAPRGFFQAMGGGFESSLLDGRLGHPWFFLEPGVSIKPHPGGSLTHPAMAVMQRLIGEHQLRADLVERVVVGTNSNMPNALIHHRPRTSLEAKFSMEFSMAVLLVKGRAGLQEYTDDVVLEPAIQDMIGRVDFRVDPVCEQAGFHRMLSRITVKLRDGRELFAEGEHGKGHPQNPLTAGEFKAKYLENMAVSVDRPTAERIWRAVDSLEDLAEARQLLRPVAPAGMVH